jgi:acyl-CoA reductase-like NAD-dependent aldehyde dehydrogenase
VNHSPPHHDRIGHSEVGLAGIEQGSYSEVLEISETESDTFDAFNEVVHAFGRSVGDTVLMPGDNGVEPVAKHAREPSHFERRGPLRAVVDNLAKEVLHIICGGVNPLEERGRGYRVEPTVFSDVTRDMTIAQEEIFGPALSIIPYDTEEEAIEIANDSSYGLACGVWATTNEKTFEEARTVCTGQVEINGGSFNVIAPFRGYKQSGIGRELGQHSFEEFLEAKAIQHNESSKPPVRTGIDSSRAGSSIGRAFDS